MLLFRLVFGKTVWRLSTITPLFWALLLFEMIGVPHPRFWHNVWDFSSDQVFQRTPPHLLSRQTLTLPQQPSVRPTLRLPKVKVMKQRGSWHSRTNPNLANIDRSAPVLGEKNKQLVCFFTCACNNCSTVGMVSSLHKVVAIEQRGGIWSAVVRFRPNIIASFWDRWVVRGFAAVQLLAHCVGGIPVPCAVWTREPVVLVSVSNCHLASAWFLPS